MLKKRSLQELTSFLERASGRFVGAFGDNNITFTDLYNNSSVVYILLKNYDIKSIENLFLIFDETVSYYHDYMDEIGDYISFDDCLKDGSFISFLSKRGFNLGGLKQWL